MTARLRIECSTTELHRRKRRSDFAKATSDRSALSPSRLGSQACPTKRFDLSSPKSLAKSETELGAPGWFRSAGSGACPSAVFFLDRVFQVLQM